jgi:hypothetical protein
VLLEVVDHLLQQLDGVLNLAECTVTAVAQPASELVGRVTVIEDESPVRPSIGRFAAKVAYSWPRASSNPDELGIAPGNETGHPESLGLRIGLPASTLLCGFYGQKALSMLRPVPAVCPLMGLGMPSRVTTRLRRPSLRVLGAPFLDPLVVALSQTAQFLGI